MFAFPDILFIISIASHNVLVTLQHKHKSVGIRRVKFTIIPHICMANNLHSVIYSPEGKTSTNVVFNYVFLCKIRNSLGFQLIQVI